MCCWSICSFDYVVIIVFVIAAFSMIWLMASVTRNSHSCCVPYMLSITCCSWKMPSPNRTSTRYAHSVYCLCPPCLGLLALWLVALKLKLGLFNHTRKFGIHKHTSVIVRINFLSLDRSISSRAVNCHPIQSKLSNSKTVDVDETVCQWRDNSNPWVDYQTRPSLFSQLFPNRWPEVNDAVWRDVTWPDYWYNTLQCDP